MAEANNELLEIVRDIRNLLKPISACFEEQYAQIQQQKRDAKLQAFEGMLNPTRRAIYPLLFDPRRLSQVEIAKVIGKSQPTVSQFISMLLEQDLIDQIEDQGKMIYTDKWNLVEMLQRKENKK